MKNKILFSFDDEVVSKFCFDIDSNIIEVYFSGYSDLKRNKYVNEPCKWVVKNWEKAQSRIGDENRRYDLNNHIGIFNLILYFKYNENDEFEMLVNTIDNRYITLYFKEPQIELIEIS